MQHFGCKYPPEQDCYGARFADWLRSPTPATYNSFVNGSAMRVSPCPQAIIAFLESDSFEDAVRNAVSMGGDSDTIGAIAGSIAWAYYYDRSDDTFSRLIDAVNKYLPQEFIRIIEEFESVRHV